MYKSALTFGSRKWDCGDESFEGIHFFFRNTIVIIVQIAQRFFERAGWTRLKMRTAANENSRDCSTKYSIKKKNYSRVLLHMSRLQCCFRRGEGGGALYSPRGFLYISLKTHKRLKKWALYGEKK